MRLPPPLPSTDKELVGPMVMRAMRDNTKWIMLILTVAFVGWLVFDWVQSGSAQGGGNANPVVGTVNGEEIRYVEWNRFLQGQMDQARQQVEGSLSDQQLHRVREQTWDQMVTQRLIQQELDRLGLRASESEIRRAFRTSPPPSLRDHPAFQTDGQFDMQKYQQFFAQRTVNEQLLLQIENYYREQIPRSKLYQLVAEEVSLSDAELWQHFRDRNATARVRFVGVAPDQVVPDSAVEPTEEEIRAHYEEHSDEFSRPRVSVVDLVSLDAQPSPEDSAAARSTVDSIRSLVAGGDASFDDVVQQISEEGAGGMRASRMGPMEREELVGPLQQVAFSAPVGELRGPVESPSGYHLVRVEDRGDDEVTLNHVLVPVRLSLDSENRLFDTMDRLEGIALRSDLETAADSLGMEFRDDLRLEEGSDFVSGAGNLAVAVSWTFESGTQVGALSQFFENAGGYHLFELEERLPAGVRPLEEVRDEIRSTLLSERRTEAARERLTEIVASIRAGDRTLEDVASERGWELREAGPFTRVEFVPGLGRGTPAVGAAFGLEAGRVAGPVEGAGGLLAVLELIERTPANRREFEVQKTQLRQQLTGQRQQEHIQRWLQALREEAEIRDLRDRLDRGQGGQGQQPARAS